MSTGSMSMITRRSIDCLIFDFQVLISLASSDSFLEDFDLIRTCQRFLPLSFSIGQGLGPSIRQGVFCFPSSSS